MQIGIVLEVKANDSSIHLGAKNKKKVRRVKHICILLLFKSVHGLLINQHTYVGTALGRVIRIFCFIIMLMRICALMSFLVFLSAGAGAVSRYYH
jgi:hypothetical protein